MDLFKKINNSLEKSYWIYYKYNLGWILHNKNLYYIKTKIYNLCLKNITKYSIPSFYLSSSPGTSSLSSSLIFKFFGHFLKVLSFSPVFNQLTCGSLKDTSASLLNSPFFDSFSWFKVKNISISFYYIHLLYIKFIMLNLWKSFFLMTEHLSRKKYKNYKSFILSQVIKPLSFQIYTKIDRFFLLAFNLKSDSFFSSQSSLIQHKSDNLLFLSDFSFFLQKIILFNFHSFSNYLFSFKQNSLHSLDSSFLTNVGNTKILNFFYNSCSASSVLGASSALSSPSLTPCSENGASSASSPTFSYFSDKHLFSLTNLLRSCIPFHTYSSHSYFFKIIPQSFRLFLTDLFFFFFSTKNWTFFYSSLYFSYPFSTYWLCFFWSDSTSFFSK